MSSTIIGAVISFAIAFDFSSPFYNIYNELGHSVATVPEATTAKPEIPNYKAVVDMRFIIIGSLFIVGLVYFSFVRKPKQNSLPATTKIDELCRAELSIADAPKEAISTTYKKRQAIRNIFRSKLTDMVNGENELLVSHLNLSNNIFSVDPKMAIQECNDSLNQKGYRRAMVVDKRGKLHGVVSKKDIASKSGKIVADVMSSDPKTVSPDTTLQVAISVLMCHRISCLPIVDDEKLVGILTMSDLIVALQVILLAFSEKELAEVSSLSSRNLLISKT